MSKPLIEDQLDLSPDLLKRLVDAGITSARALSQRSRGEVYCLLYLANEGQLRQVEDALEYRGLQLRKPAGRLIDQTIGRLGSTGCSAAKTLTRRYRLQTLEELEFLGREKIKLLYRIGPNSKALTVIDEAMNNADIEWQQRPIFS